jgi:hypothetical protein
LQEPCAGSSARRHEKAPRCGALFFQARRPLTWPREPRWPAAWPLPA